MDTLSSPLYLDGIIVSLLLIVGIRYLWKHREDYDKSWAFLGFGVTSLIIIISAYNSMIIPVHYNQIVTARTFIWFGRVWGRVNYVDVAMLVFFILFSRRLLTGKSVLQRARDRGVFLWVALAFLIWGSLGFLAHRSFVDDWQDLFAVDRMILLFMFGYLASKVVLTNWSRVKVFAKTISLFGTANLITGAFLMVQVPMYLKWDRYGRGCLFVDQADMVLCVFLFWLGLCGYVYSKRWFYAGLAGFTIFLLTYSLVKAQLLMLVVFAIAASLIDRKLRSAFVKIGWACAMLAAIMVLAGGKLTSFAGSYTIMDDPSTMTRVVQAENVFRNLSSAGTVGILFGLGSGTHWIEYDLQPTDTGAWMKSEQRTRYKLAVQSPGVVELKNFGILGAVLAYGVLVPFALGFISTSKRLTTDALSSPFMKALYIASGFCFLDVYLAGSFVAGLPEAEFVSGVMLAINEYLAYAYARGLRPHANVLTSNSADKECLLACARVPRTLT